MGRPNFVGDAISQMANGLHVGQFGDYRLAPAFQPIFKKNLFGEFIVHGYEGLLRASSNGNMIPPNILFGSVAAQDRLFLECMSQALHIRNYCNATPDKRQLFLNVNSAVYAAEDVVDREIGYTVRRLADHGIAHSMAVFEILETQAHSNGVLQRLSGFSKDSGIRLAMDDFGTHASDLERYSMLRPSIVKIDRQYFATAFQHQASGKLLKSLIRQFHDDGAEVLIEGIETADEWMFAVRSGADMLQGYYLCKPLLLPHKFTDGPDHIRPCLQAAPAPHRPAYARAN
ncbi:MAG: EAL domain-containing protein [Pseudomonadota bacterium]